MTWDLSTAGAAWEWAQRLWMLLLLVWAVLWNGAKQAKKRESWSQRAGYIILLILGAGLLFGPNLPWPCLDERVLPNVPMVWKTGLALTALGVGVAIWARLILGANWSGTVTLKRDHELVRRGPYRWIRHPIYTGMVLAMAGSGVIRDHLKGWIGIAIVLAAFYIKARREERFLSEEFGDSYREHSRRTGMFLPKVI